MTPPCGQPTWAQDTETAQGTGRLGDCIRAEPCASGPSARRAINTLFTPDTGLSLKFRGAMADKASKLVAFTLEWGAPAVSECG